MWNICNMGSVWSSFRSGASIKRKKRKRSKLFNHKRCFGTMVLGAFVGGVYASITKVTVYVMTNANFLSLLGFVGGTKSNIVNGVVSCILSMFVAVVFTYFAGFSKKELKESK